jgi:hypothetical protein
VNGWSESYGIQRDVESCEIYFQYNELFFKLNPICENEEWDFVSNSDSDWAGIPETRISVIGFIIYLLGVPICWRLKGQKDVTLSSSEAEYVRCNVRGS